jgi:hypothetical protein
MTALEKCVSSSLARMSWDVRMWLNPTGSGWARPEVDSVTALVKGVSLKGTLARKVLYYEDSKLRRRKESFSMRSRAI